jgi:hypothetical protein
VGGQPAFDPGRDGFHKIEVILYHQLWRGGIDHICTHYLLLLNPSENLLKCFFDLLGFYKGKLRAKTAVLVSDSKKGHEYFRTWILPVQSLEIRQAASGYGIAHQL